MPHTITVLHVPRCIGGAAALAVASRIAGARGDVEIRDVIIEDEETALASGFRGSPTVLVDGREVAPDVEIAPGSMG